MVALQTKITTHAYTHTQADTHTHTPLPPPLQTVNITFLLIMFAVLQTLQRCMIWGHSSLYSQTFYAARRQHFDTAANEKINDGRDTSQLPL